jgi:hypothetical protein
MSPTTDVETETENPRLTHLTWWYGPEDLKGYMRAEELEGLTDEDLTEAMMEYFVCDGLFLMLQEMLEAAIRMKRHDLGLKCDYDDDCGCGDDCGCDD